MVRMLWLRLSKWRRAMLGRTNRHPSKESPSGRTRRVSRCALDRRRLQTCPMLTPHAPLFRGQVILAGGVFNTPQLLELSGVGDAKLLSSLGIDSVVDLPGVGENLKGEQGRKRFPQMACGC
ncbi:hypothetical protein IE81DRAFT_325749 [Ceraceosorus guamensis]|uniref:Glucose-methanol-choline oxidoreductase N-terminal domain-containing protein n=1 Tax=Ceraceosorus guamensis TaxID=1522189 RepID=A0A316VRP6_9BASI|nr:hypothetical protein IE81DRAFT_325749 [Ceraceosorus guamensis]PWN40276.1 hypothetical protein IE81DRAFT_325749 [Ceraceosorus guamensis]